MFLGFDLKQTDVSMIELWTRSDSLHFAIILSSAFPSLTIVVLATFSLLINMESQSTVHVHFYRPILGILKSYQVVEDIQSFRPYTEFYNFC